MCNGETIVVTRPISDEIEVSTLGVIDDIDKEKDSITLLFPILGKRTYKYEIINRISSMDHVFNKSSMENNAMLMYEMGLKSS